MKNIDTLSLQKQFDKRKPSMLDHEQFSKSAVLVPLIKHAEEWHLLFEVRSANLKRQPGEICFPGGRIDADDPGAQGAAVRETCEELGLNEEDIEVWGALDYLVTPFKMLIYPYVGVLNVDSEALKPNPAEVASVFYVPLEFLLKTRPEYYELDLYAQPEKNFPFHLIPQQENYNWRTGKIPEYFYFYQEYVIWGMTARILHHFLEIVKQAGILDQFA